MFYKIRNRIKSNNGRKPQPNAMIIVEKTKKRIFRRVAEKRIPSNSFEKEYRGQWLHILGLDLKGTFWPIERPATAEGRMPTDLFMAKHCAEEVNDVYGMSMPTVEKIKLGIFAGIIIAIVIVIFLIVAAAGG